MIKLGKGYVLIALRTSSKKFCEGAVGGAE